MKLDLCCCCYKSKCKKVLKILENVDGNISKGDIYVTVDRSLHELKLLIGECL